MSAELEHRDAVDRIAREWIGTPYHDHGEVKGGGVDCAKLLKCVFVEAGIIADFTIPHYSPQVFLHKASPLYLEQVLQHAHEVPIDQVKHGDVVLYFIGKAFAHGGIVIKPGWPHIVHAHYGSRCVRIGLGTSVHLGSPIKDMKFFTRW